MLFAARPRPQVKEGRTRFLVTTRCSPNVERVAHPRSAPDINLELMAREDMQAAAEQGGVFDAWCSTPTPTGRHKT